MRNNSQFHILPLLFLLLTGMLMVPLHSQGQTADVYVQGTCIPDNSGGGGGGGGGTPASTKFFVDYSQQPDSVYWLFEINPQGPTDSLESRELHPVYTFSQPGTYNVLLHAFYNSSGTTDTIITPVNVEIKQIDTQIILKEVKEDGTEEQISGEVVLCGASKTIKAYTSGGSGSGGETPVPVTWYKPQSSDIPNPVISQDSIQVTTDLVQGVSYDKYKDVGTYYITYNPNPGDPNSCTVYQTFNVVVYNESDQNSSIWYFGNNAGIDFRENKAIDSGGKINAPEGVAITGDVNADILFATDGKSLWYGNILESEANGSNMGGSPDVTQNSLFVDYPSDETLFYLFTINNSGQLSYSLLDLKAPTPPPGLALADGGTFSGQPIKTIPLTDEAVTEKLTSTGRTDGGTWVVTHELNSNAFLSYPLTQEGIGKPVRSEIGPIHTDGSGYLRFSEGGKVLATTYNNSGNSSSIYLHKFYADSGIVSTPTVELPVAPGTLYGLVFADSMMYATVYNDDNNTSYFYQFKVDSTLSTDEILDSKIEIEVPGERLGALEIDPNGILNIARDGSNELFTLTSPGVALDPNYDVTSSTFELAPGTFSTLGLPNFGENAGSSPREASISATSVCEGEDVEVTATQRYQNDEQLKIELLAEDRNTILKTYFEVPTGQGVEFTIPPADYGNNPGSYFVRLSIANECSPPGVFDYPSQDDEPIISSFTVYPIPTAGLDTPAELEFCNNQTVTFIGKALIDGQEVDTSTVNFIWMEGNNVLSNEKELTVEKPGFWELIVSSGEGCFSDPIYVSAIDLRPQADLGPDINICVGAPLPRQKVGVNNRLQDFTIEWSLNTGTGFTPLTETSDSISIDGIDTSVAGTYQYAVRASSTSGNNCFKVDTLTIRVNEIPLVDITASDNKCTGSATLTAEVEGATGQVTFQWFGPGIVSGRGASQIRINQSGDYYVQITDGASQCSSASEPYTINLEDPLDNLKIEVEAGCGELAQNKLTAVTSYTDSGLEFEWFKKDGNNFEPFGEGTEIYASEGEYKVVATINNPASTCKKLSKDTTTTVSKTTIPVLQPTYVICPNIRVMARDTITLEGYNSYEWKNVTTDQVVSRRAEFIITQEGNYELRVNECSEPARFRVIYDCTPVLWLPNAIRFNSPVNGNGTFKILNPGMAENIQNFQILILNRWGEVLFQSTNPAFEWNGTDRQGQPVMVNTYVYVITYRNRFGEDNAPKQQRGGITVLK